MGESLKNGNVEKNGSFIKVSANTIKFIIEIVTLTLVVSGWGWTIKMEQKVQAVKMERIAHDAAMARVLAEEIRVTLASKGIIVVRPSEPKGGSQ